VRILVTNHWLRKLGGSETFTYTLAGELVRQGHDVDLFTMAAGEVSNRIKKDFGIPTRVRESYDLILANHHTTVDFVFQRGLTLQTCHGISPRLEKISPNAQIKVAISQEVADHISTSNIIWNGIDCDRFIDSKKLSTTPKRLLSLVHGDKANQIIKAACLKLGIDFIEINKYKTQVWDMPGEINQADIVVSLGRGAYEAMSCGRPVIVFDSRPYQDCFGDGYVNEENIHELMKNNCSGRRYKKKFTVDSLIEEIKKYNIENGQFLRNFAFQNLNMKKQVKKYLDLKSEQNK
jgi:glycosyltransferase involved in cell wall biosynthesis